MKAVTLDHYLIQRNNPCVLLAQTYFGPSWLDEPVLPVPPVDNSSTIVINFAVFEVKYSLSNSLLFCYLLCCPSPCAIAFSQLKILLWWWLVQVAIGCEAEFLSVNWSWKVLLWLLLMTFNSSKCCVHLCCALLEWLDELSFLDAY